MLLSPAHRHLSPAHRHLSTAHSHFPPAHSHLSPAHSHLPLAHSHLSPAHSRLSKCNLSKCQLSVVCLLSRFTWTTQRPSDGFCPSGTLVNVQLVKVQLVKVQLVKAQLVKVQLLVVGLLCRFTSTTQRPSGGPCPSGTALSCIARPTAKRYLPYRWHTFCFCYGLLSLQAQFMAQSMQLTQVLGASYTAYCYKLRSST